MATRARDCTRDTNTTGFCVSEDCWFDIGASSQGDGVFLKSCGTDQLEDGDTTLILEQDAYGATANLYGSGSLTIEKGQLITLTASTPETAQQALPFSACPTAPDRADQQSWAHNAHFRRCAITALRGSALRDVPLRDPR